MQYLRDEIINAKILNVYFKFVYNFGIILQMKKSIAQV